MGSGRSAWVLFDSCGLWMDGSAGFYWILVSSGVSWWLGGSAGLCLILVGSGWFLWVG
jgi:hypothetical protein